MKLINFETATRSNWKWVSKSLGREEGKPEHWELYEYTTYWQHLGLCQRFRLILCAWKLDWKGMQMLFLICIILSSSHDADIVISLSWCIKANKAERELWGILVNVNPRILLVYFAVAAFLKSFLKSAQSRKKREMKTLKSQSHKMIDSCVVWNFLIWCWDWALISDQSSHSQYVSQMFCRPWPLKIEMLFAQKYMGFLRDES